MAISKGRWLQLPEWNDSQGLGCQSTEVEHKDLNMITLSLTTHILQMFWGIGE